MKKETTIKNYIMIIERKKKGRFNIRVELDKAQNLFS